MTKKHFIALADAIRDYNEVADPYTTGEPFTRGQVEMLAGFCEQQNPCFNREHWLGYVAGTNGKFVQRKAA